jgi:SAM-dependent methyltransferase
MRNPTERFSDRVENYAKYRPGYPEAMLRLFQDLVPQPAVVADVGSGTGILTRQLLSAGFEVYAIEPNDPMRREAERFSNPLFHSLKASAESTLLADRSIDFITSAQAFHWFDRAKAKNEFRRILKPGKLTALIWNERQTDTSAFSWKYEELLQAGAPEYSRVDHRNVKQQDIRSFFAPWEVRLEKFPNGQVLTREAFIGRVLSSSYVPLAGQPGHESILAAAERLFDENAVGETVSFEYQTTVYIGRIDE